MRVAILLVLTELDFMALAGMLHALGFNVAVSKDAGLYLCNFIFYLSLRECAVQSQQALHSLFVHVPLFDKIPMDEQLLFMVAVINAITAVLTTAEAPVSSLARAPAPVVAELVA